jgi:hypothetical protein
VSPVPTLGPDSSGLWGAQLAPVRLAMRAVESLSAHLHQHVLNGLNHSYDRVCFRARAD